MRIINKKDLVPTELIKTYQDIDGLKVIEDLLLFKGTSVVDYIAYTDKIPVVSLKQLEQMAFIIYGLKVNATNKLFVGMYLEKFYLRSDMIATNSGRSGVWIKVPKEIIVRVEKVNSEFKNKSQYNET